MIKRNHTYSVGDTEYSMEGYKLVCKTAGTTAPTPIDMGGGQTIIDGTVEWEVTLGEDAMLSDVYVNLNRGTATSVSFSYTATANGWICWMDNPYSSNSFMRIECGHNVLYKAGNVHHGNLNTDCIVSCPITRGDTVRFYGSNLTYNAYSTIRFYYSVGEAKRLGLI